MDNYHSGSRLDVISYRFCDIDILLSKLRTEQNGDEHINTFFRCLLNDRMKIRNARNGEEQYNGLLSFLDRYPKLSYILLVLYPTRIDRAILSRVIQLAMDNRSDILTIDAVNVLMFGSNYSLFRRIISERIALSTDQFVFVINLYKSIDIDSLISAVTGIDEDLITEDDLNKLNDDQNDVIEIVIANKKLGGIFGKPPIFRRFYRRAVNKINLSIVLASLNKDNSVLSSFFGSMWLFDPIVFKRIGTFISDDLDDDEHKRELIDEQDQSDWEYSQYISELH